MANNIGNKHVENKKQSKEKLERLKLGEVWEIATDKRFGIRFKIANLICRDYLRNYLAVASMRIDDCIDILEHPLLTDETKLRHIERNLRRAKKTLDEVFEFLTLNGESTVALHFRESDTLYYEKTYNLRR